jgi:hypothetical protein
MFVFALLAAIGAWFVTALAPPGRIGVADKRDLSGF